MIVDLQNSDITADILSCSVNVIASEHDIHLQFLDTVYIDLKNQMTIHVLLLI